MSVFITGMEAPKDCRECMLSEYHGRTGKTWCKPADKLLAEDRKPIPFDGRPDWCPIAELPEKHGDLIDADELFAESQKDGAYGYIDSKQIHDAPVVIEAEGEG